MAYGSLPNSAISAPGWVHLDFLADIRQSVIWCHITRRIGCLSSDARVGEEIDHQIEMHPPGFDN